MSSVLTDRELETIADLLKDLGVGADRVRLHPAPGEATEKDVLAIHTSTKRLCELVDGVLVEKGMGFRESCLASFLIIRMGPIVEAKNLGLVSGESGMMRLMPKLVRIPDVAFISWERVPGGRMPAEPIPDLVPDLAVEILSESNTEKEMQRKCKEYFEAGVRLVWLVDPEARAVKVFSAREEWTELTEADTLDGGAVLPDFRLPLRELFAELDRQSAKPE